MAGNIDFDVLIAVEDKQGDDMGGGLKVAGLLNIGGGISDESISKNHNRIKFSLPVAFSTSTTPKEYKPKKNTSTLR